MKFLKEVTESVEYLFEESKDPSKPKQYFIEGIFMQGDIKNRNGRIYPTKTLVKEMNRYLKEKVEPKLALGELNHPDTPAVNPERASHLITNLWVEGNNIMGRAKVLDTPLGKIVKTLMDEGVKIGVSSRGFGTVSNVNGTKMVGEDFHLSTVDIVSDPSAPNAFVESILESKEYALLEGQIIEVNEATEKAILEKHGHVYETLSEENTSEKLAKLNEELVLKEFEKLLSESFKHKTEIVHMSKLNHGDTIMENGKMVTLGKNDIKSGNIRGKTYRETKGNVERVLFPSYKEGKISGYTTQR